MSHNFSDSDASQRVGDGTTTRSPRNIGILSIATYFPKTYVSQEDLEVFDKVSSGKYTKGLMQDKMGFCTDIEDINSIALTVTRKLLDQSGVPLTKIGYLEVGTETILDKSKSVKTVLMELFAASGNTDIEGVDTTNACYGGTAALFHAIDHCSTPHWDGRLAVVVTADIAVYDKGSARPTGGCGAVAMLIGPDAPLVFDPFRATHMAHVYDFYKPDPTSEYPTVDGKLSVQAYLDAIDKCYQVYRRKYLANNPDIDGRKISLLDHFDGIVMHSPYCKQVVKAFARLLFIEYETLLKEGQIDPITLDRYKLFSKIPQSHLTLDYRKWLEPIGSDTVEKIATQASDSLYQEKTAKSLFISNQVGNMYTASLYACLAGYLISKPEEELVDKPLLFFSYGSGSASSMFSARISRDISAVKQLLSGIADITAKLGDRIKVDPEEFTAHLEHKKKTFRLADRSPVGKPFEDKLDSQEVSLSYLYPGTYYLTKIDSLYRREYTRYDGAVENNNNEDSCVMTKSHIQKEQQTVIESSIQASV